MAAKQIGAILLDDDLPAPQAYVPSPQLEGDRFAAPPATGAAAAPTASSAESEPAPEGAAPLNPVVTNAPEFAALPSSADLMWFGDLPPIYDGVTDGADPSGVSEGDAGDDSGIVYIDDALMPAILADGTIEWFSAGSALPEGAVWADLSDFGVIDPVIDPPLESAWSLALLFDGSLAWFDEGTDLPTGAEVVSVVFSENEPVEIPEFMLPALLSDGTYEWFAYGAMLPEGAVWARPSDAFPADGVILPAVMAPALLADGTIEWFTAGAELPEGAVWTEIPVDDGAIVDPAPVLGEDAIGDPTGDLIFYPAVMRPALLADGVTIEWFTYGGDLPEGAVWTDLVTSDLWLTDPIWVADPLPIVDDGILADPYTDGFDDAFSGFVEGDEGDATADDTIIADAAGDPIIDGTGSWIEPVLVDMAGVPDVIVCELPVADSLWLVVSEPLMVTELHVQFFADIAPDATLAAAPV